MKLFLALIAATVCAIVAGCASAPDANENTPVVAKDDRCTVTGSNLPRRDCRDLVVLPPESADRLGTSPAVRSTGTR